MRRAFTLQLEPRPEGRLFTCPTCDIASMHPEDVTNVVCPNCSPFLSVTHDPLRGPQGVIVAVCRWVTAEVMIFNLQDATEWMAANPHIPDIVLDSLRTHFITKLMPILLKPPPAHMAHLATEPQPRQPPLPQIQQSGVMKVIAGADINVGDILVADHQGNKTPVGTAINSAKAGETVEVQLGVIDEK